MKYQAKKYTISIARFRADSYNRVHIRPLAVSPLNHPESVPIPWGFSISERPICVAVLSTKGANA